MPRAVTCARCGGPATPGLMELYCVNECDRPRPPKPAAKRNPRREGYQVPGYPPGTRIERVWVKDDRLYCEIQGKQYSWVGGDDDGEWTEVPSGWMSTATWTFPSKKP